MNRCRAFFGLTTLCALLLTACSGSTVSQQPTGGETGAGETPVPSQSTPTEPLNPAADLIAETKEGTPSSGDQPKVASPPASVRTRSTGGASVPMLFGNSARDGQQPGPGPTSLPAVRWTFHLGTTVLPLERVAPALADGLLYVPAEDGRLFAIDASTGEEVWRFEASTGGYVSSPAVVDDTVFFGFSSDDDSEDFDGDFDGAFYALDAATGNVRWRFEIGSVAPSPAVADGVVYMVAGRVVHALDASSGAELWRSELDTEPTWVYEPVVVDGLVIVPTDNGALTLNAETGEELEILRTYFDSQAMVAADLLFSSSQGETWSLALRKRKERLLRLVAPLSAGVEAVTDKTIYGRSSFKIAAVDLPNAGPRWILTEDEIGAGFEGRLALALGTIYVPTNDAGLLAIDEATGDVRWHGTFAGDLCPSVPVIANGMIYIICGDGMLYALGEAGPDALPISEVQPPIPVIEVGSRVTIVGSDAQLRRAPSSAGAVVEDLTPGTELEVDGSAEEVAGVAWWPVMNVDSGDEGYVEDRHLALPALGQDYQEGIVIKDDCSAATELFGDGESLPVIEGDTYPLFAMTNDANGYYYYWSRMPDDHMAYIPESCLEVDSSG